MSPELIRAALVFLQRTDIKGGEAAIMMRVCQELEALAMANGAGDSQQRMAALRRPTNGPASLSEGGQE